MSDKSIDEKFETLLAYGKSLRKILETQNKRITFLEDQLKKSLTRDSAILQSLKNKAR